MQGNPTTSALETNEANREKTDRLQEITRDGGDDFTITPVSLHVDDIGTASRGEVGTGPSNHSKLAERIAGIFGKEVVWITSNGDFSINGVVVPGGELMENDADRLPDEPSWTEEEWKLAPYSDVKGWERVLEGQYLVGSHLLKGPPGLWEKVVAQIDAEGLEAARERFLVGKMANGDSYFSSAEARASSVSNRLTNFEIESLRQEAKLADLQIQALLAEWSGRT